MFTTKLTEGNRFRSTSFFKSEKIQSISSKDCCLCSFLHELHETTATAWKRCLLDGFVNESAIVIFFLFVRAEVKLSLVLVMIEPSMGHVHVKMWRLARVYDLFIYIFL